MKTLFTRWSQSLGKLNSHAVRKIGVAVVGGTVVLIGIALLVLPGPAFIVIPLGLAILASEFIWARRWLKRARSMLPHKKKRA